MTTILQELLSFPFSGELIHSNGFNDGKGEQK